MEESLERSKTEPFVFGEHTKFEAVTGNDREGRSDGNINTVTKTAINTATIPVPLPSKHSPDLQSQNPGKTPLPIPSGKNVVHIDRKTRRIRYGIGTGSQTDTATGKQREIGLQPYRATGIRHGFRTLAPARENSVAEIISVR